MYFVYVYYSDYRAWPCHNYLFTSRVFSCTNCIFPSDWDNGESGWDCLIKSERKVRIFVHNITVVATTLSTIYEVTNNLNCCIQNMRIINCNLYYKISLLRGNISGRSVVCTTCIMEPTTHCLYIFPLNVHFRSSPPRSVVDKPVLVLSMRFSGVM